MKKILLLILTVGLVLGLTNSLSPDFFNKMFSFCDDIQDISVKNDCYVKKALNKKDITLCGKINETYSSNSFFAKAHCYSNVSKLSKDESVCKNITWQQGKDICYSHLAYNKEDPVLCNYIKDDKQKGICNLGIAWIKEDPLFCEKINNSKIDRYWCYISLAKKKQDMTLCENIELFDVLNSLRDCYLNATNESAPKLCDKITNYKEKDKCYASVATSPVTCEKISSDNIKGLCYWNTAVITKNSTLCEIFYSPVKKLCLEGTSPSESNTRAYIGN